MRFLSECIDLKLVIALLCLLIVAERISAQEFRGTIAGRVSDVNGALVPGAQVKFTNPATNIPTETKTDDAGNYFLLYVPAGQYKVSVEAKGFKTLVLSQPVEVRVGDKLALNFVLEVGEVSESVTVATEAPLLEAATATAGSVPETRPATPYPGVFLPGRVAGR